MKTNDKVKSIFRCEVSSEKKKKLFYGCPSQRLSDMLVCSLLGTYVRVSDPDPIGFVVFANPVSLLMFLMIRIQIWFSYFSGSGSGFQISEDPDPFSARIRVLILEQKKSAEKALKVIY